jgi:hypothetical protein
VAEKQKICFRLILSNTLPDSGYFFKVFDLTQIGKDFMRRKRRGIVKPCELAQSGMDYMRRNLLPFTIHYHR